eukprot:738913-Pelagomonas_calceolata.AAC.1
MAAITKSYKCTALVGLCSWEPVRQLHFLNGFPRFFQFAPGGGVAGGAEAHQWTIRFFFLLNCGWWSSRWNCGTSIGSAHSYWALEAGSPLLASEGTVLVNFFTSGVGAQKGAEAHQWMLGGNRGRAGGPEKATSGGGGGSGGGDGGGGGGG